jgi:hypothetical protein
MLAAGRAVLDLKAALRQALREQRVRAGAVKCRIA